MPTIDQKLIHGVTNEMRAMEANARISKVLLKSLVPNVRQACEQLDCVAPDTGPLKEATARLIHESDAYHDKLNEIAKGNTILIDEDDENVILVEQCCGGK